MSHVYTEEIDSEIRRLESISNRNLDEHKKLDIYRLASFGRFMLKEMGRIRESVDDIETQFERYKRNYWV